jgi:hypothetical protein
MSTETVLSEVHAERERQRARWGDSHDDDEHHAGELAGAAAALAIGISEDGPLTYDDAPAWGFDLVAEHENDRRRQLLIATTLLVAEIERIDRRAAK